jgi:hypothetical protein
MKHYLLRMELDLFTELAKLAKAEHRSINKQIIVLIEQAVMRAELAKEPA